MTMPSFDGQGTGWITSPSDPRLGVLWPGALDYPAGLGFPLYCAAVQCANFAPTLTVGAPIPDTWVAAQVLQCRALVRAGIVGDGDQSGGYGEPVTLFPMDWTVKALLRPKRGKPYFGGGQVTA
jgi:hypothetical protein